VGIGNTKKESQQSAAKTVLRKLKKDRDVIKLVESLKNKESSSK
jgi:hypothetical protein